MLVFVALCLGFLAGATYAAGRRFTREFEPWCERMRAATRGQSFGEAP